VIGLDQVRPSPGVSDVFLPVDLRDSSEVEKACSEIVGAYRPIWGFVSSAGIYPIVPLKEYSLDLWDEVQSVNVRSVFQIVQLLSPAFAKGGRIVLIGSGAGHIGSRDIGYSASKAALLGMVRTLARSLAPAGILVNAVCPGLVATPMSARMKTEDVQDYMTRIPLGRKGTPGEVAVCVSFLLEEENSYMTGASLDVNGGLYTR
jgi:3-oxoacyl-[acyl-carrier protein] reductase